MSDNQNTPMSFADYLMSHLSQECAEVIVRCTKAQHFGLDEVQPGQEFTNRERIVQELCDVFAMCEVMRREGILPDISNDETERRLAAKKDKARIFRDYSRELKRLV